MDTTRGNSTPEPPPAAVQPPECQLVELARFRVETAAVAARRVLACPGREPEGAAARRVRSARSKLWRARRELAADVERIGAVECATAQEAAPLVAALWRAERTLGEAGRLLRALGAALDRAR